MKVEDIFEKLFEFEFCEPSEKVDKEQAYEGVLKKACEETGKPLYVLKPAIQKRYPAYRAKRLAKELPDLPPEIRPKKFET